MSGPATIQVKLSDGSTVTTDHGKIADVTMVADELGALTLAGFPHHCLSGTRCSTANRARR